MDNVDITEATAQPGLDIAPSHKISITHGSDVYVYWYVKQKPNCRDFDEMKDSNLIEAMHTKGMKMNIGDSESINICKAKDYHLKRRGSHDFVIESLN